MVSLFSVYMGIRGCDVNLLLSAGAFADAVFLGALGMITSSICNNTVIAYMAPMIYYALNYGAGGKLQNFYLFSMTTGLFEPKLWLFATGVILIIVSIMLREIRKKFC